MPCALKDGPEQRFCQTDKVYTNFTDGWFTGGWLIDISHLLASYTQHQHVILRSQLHLFSLCKKSTKALIRCARDGIFENFHLREISVIEFTRNIRNQLCSSHCFPLIKVWMHISLVWTHPLCQYKCLVSEYFRTYNFRLSCCFVH